MSGKNQVPEIDRMAVRITHLDRLLSLTGEIIITASNISILQRHLQSSEQHLEKASVEMVKSAALTANRISSDLHQLVMDIRLIPVRDTFLRFRRLVRDLARKKGRQVNFEIVGEETLVDKTVAEKLYEPLAHQIRNAVDHGLEDPLERKQKGKDPTGQLTLTAYKKEGFTYVAVTDDGRGLDEAAIRRAAVGKGILTENAAAGLSRQDCFSLIMQPGFSTAKEATEISGRGVGMDVVKNTVEELGGEIIIESEPEQGSAFTYKIPELSAVNITDALIIRAGGDFFAIPIGSVVATQAFQREDIHTTMKTGESILYLGSIIPLHDLRELLSGQKSEKNEDNVPVIIIEAKNGRTALTVSEFIRPQKLVLIPLPGLFAVQGVSGTTILGGNQLGLVLDPFELIAMATGRSQTDTADEFLSHAQVAFDDFETPGPAAQPDSGDAEQPDRTDDAAAEAGDATQTAMDEKLAEEFYIEIGDILKALNEDIFQLEKEPGNSQRVNTIFRHFHSIKGNLIMTGFNALGGFVHDVESVLDRIRDKELEISSDLIDLFLDAVRVIEDAMKNIRTGGGYEIRDTDLLKSLEKYRRAEGPPPEKRALSTDGAFQPGPLGRLLMQAKRAQGAGIFQCLIRIEPRFQEPFLVAYLILRRLAMAGDVIDTIPSLENIENGLVENSFKVLFATRYSQEDVERFARNQLFRHYGVVEFENLPVE